MTVERTDPRAKTVSERKGCSRRPCGRALRSASLALVLAAGIAQADDSERFSISLGVFVTDRDSTTRIDASTGEVGTDVELETDLALPTSDNVFRVDGYFKLNERHRFDLSYFDLSRTAEKRLQKDIIWNGTLYPSDVVVNSEFNLEIYKAAYTWSFLRRDAGFLGLTAGLYIGDIGTILEASSIGALEVGDVTAPLPVVGLRGEYDFAGKWTVRASGEIFAVEYGDWEGSLIDVYVGLDYQLFERAALGVGFNAVAIDVEVDKDSFSGSMDWGYSGALVFLKFDF